MGERLRVYLAGPISKGGLAANIKQGTDAAVTLMRAGFAPFCPQLTCYMGGDLPAAAPAGFSHDDWLGVNLQWVAVSDAVLRLPGESVGADREVACADELGIPVYDSMPFLIANLVPRRPSKPAVAGVSPDAPLVTNAAGGRQSGSPYRCDLLPARAVLDVARVLKAGCDKYGPDNWRKIGAADHVNHVLVHLFAHQAGDVSDDHLAHAACRMLMGLEMALMEKT